MATGYAPHKVIDDDGSSHFALELIEYKSLQEQWKEAHPDEIWIIDEVSPTCYYINSSRLNLYYIKRFSSQEAAEKWLTNQGADYLTRADYNWLIAARKRKAART